MKKIIAVFALALLLIPGVALCSDPDIEEFYTNPSKPYEGEDFDVIIEAYDSDGIDRIKLYDDDSDLIGTKYCDGDKHCDVEFESYERDYGFYYYEVKVYNDDGDYETKELRIQIREDYEPENLEITYFYAVPNNPNANTYFEIQTQAKYDDGIEKIRLYVDRNYEDYVDCGGSTRCTAEFGIVENVPGYHEYKVRVYGDDGETEERETRIFVSEYFKPTAYCGDGRCEYPETYYTCPSDCSAQSYCGNGICSSDESCSSCPADCGPCNIAYCGDGICEAGESCSSCSLDCGSCPVYEVPATVYTCEQRGGTCCANGGEEVVSGAADCPSTCFSSCNAAASSSSENISNSPSGAFVAGNMTLSIEWLVLGALGAIFVVLFFFALRK